MARTPIPTWFFALVVVRRGDQFLLVQEPERHGGGYYLPAGRVEPGESLEDAAVRETLEASGIAVALDGLLRLEHSVQPGGGCRVRAFLVAHPIDDRPPKSVPDHESQGAIWVTLEQAARLTMRGRDALEALHLVERGGAVLPMTGLAREGGVFLG